MQLINYWNNFVYCFKVIAIQAVRR